MPDDNLRDVTALVLEKESKAGNPYWAFRPFGSSTDHGFSPYREVEVEHNRIFDLRVKPTGDGWYFAVAAVPGQPQSMDEVGQFIRCVHGMGADKADEVAAHLRQVLGNLTGFQIAEAVRERGPSLFTPVDKIGKVMSERLYELFTEFDEVEYDFVETMTGLGFPRESSARWRFTLAYCRAQEDLTAEIRENPYTLSNLHRTKLAQAVANAAGLTRPIAYDFKTVDRTLIERAPELWASHRHRIREMIAREVDHALGNGHTVVLAREVAQRLRRQGIRSYVDETGKSWDVCERTVSYRAKDHPDLATPWVLLDQDERGVTTRRISDWQRVMAEAIQRLDKADPLFHPAEIDKMMARGERESGFTLMEEQKRGVENALAKRVSVVRGGPGTGKTTILTNVLNGLQIARNARATHTPYGRTMARTGMDIVITAPTGKAAQRIRQGLVLSEDVTTNDTEGRVKGTRPVHVRKWDHPDRTWRPYQRPDEVPVVTSMDRGGVFISTLHAFLGYRGFGFELPQIRPTFLIVDESSMLDEELFYHLSAWLLMAQTKSVPVQVLFVGDPDQLPPVGPGFPFRDLVSTRYKSFVTATTLTQVHRQAAGSMIVHASRQIRKRNLPPTPEQIEGWGIEHSDFTWLTPERVTGLPVKNGVVQFSDTVALTQFYERFLQDGGFIPGPLPEGEEAQILLALRNPSKLEPSAAYCDSANLNLQQHYASTRNRALFTYPTRNPDTGFEDELVLARGDRVVHTGVNGYDPTNSRTPIMRGSDGVVVDCLSDGVMVEYSFTDQPTPYIGPEALNGLSLAYATTCHSAQGSEYDHVLIVVPDRAGGDSLVDRAWLYTAITRAKRHCLLIASKARLDQAVVQSQGMQRLTLLPGNLASTFS